MKKYIYFILIYFMVMAPSCETGKQNKDKNLYFHWEIAGEIPNHSKGLAGAVIGVSNNLLIVGGGSNFPNAAPWNGGAKEYYQKIYLFKLVKDTLLPQSTNFNLPYKLAYSANCSTKKGVIVAGGENESGALDKVILLRWDTANNQLKIKNLPDLPVPLSGGAIAANGNQIYFAGGQHSNKVSDKLYHLNLNKLEVGWDMISILPRPITHTVLYATENKLYLVGGRKANPNAVSTLYDKVSQLDLQTMEWTQKAPLPYALSAHTGIIWNDSTLLVFSGDQGKTFHETEELIAKINQTSDATDKQVLIAKKNKLQKNHPGFKNNVLAYHINENKWEKIDTIPFPGQVTTTAVKWGQKVVIPCGEIRAGVRTPDIVLGRVR